MRDVAAEPGGAEEQTIENAFIRSYFKGPAEALEILREVVDKEYGPDVFKMFSKVRNENDFAYFHAKNRAVFSTVGN